MYHHKIERLKYLLTNERNKILNSIFWRSHKNQERILIIDEVIDLVELFENREYRREIKRTLKELREYTKVKPRKKRVKK